MTPPPLISFSSIDLGERGRSGYFGIEKLAQSILDNGLIQPIVLVPFSPPVGSEQESAVFFGLDAGGRRYHALKLLLSRGDWDGTLHHGVTSEHTPLHIGYVLKGESFTTPLQRLMTEIAENLDREDLDWRDEVMLMVKTYRLSQKEAFANSKEILMRDFGAMIGVEYMNLQAANAIHDDLIANPERYKDCTSIRGAHVKLLKINEIELTKMLAAKSLQEAPRLVDEPSSVSIQSELEPGQPQAPVAERPILIPLTTAFINCNSLEYMANLPGPTFDHIVTDPDYGVSVERLSANMSNASVGVAQATIDDSITDMREFIFQASRVIKDQGFLVFFYDLDHHEKLQSMAKSCNFAVQRWPLIWVKSDYRSNAAPAHNFCKNVEYAMVCRKPNAVLSRAQMSSVFNTGTGNITRELNHPFTKPLDLCKWIYSAITIKGQTVYDPFLGSAAMSIAAAEYGLKPVGSEINGGIYANALMNLQGAYKKLLGGNVTFS